MSPAKIAVLQQRARVSSCPWGTLAEEGCWLYWLLKALLWQVCSGWHCAPSCHELGESWQLK